MVHMIHRAGVCPTHGLARRDDLGLRAGLVAVVERDGDLGDGAGKAEMHQSMSKDGMMAMAPLPCAIVK